MAGTPVRSTLVQTVQLGLETTPGTLVAAPTLLQSTSIDVAPTPETQTFRPSGFKLPTVQALGRDFSSLSISGAPTYDELAYLFSSVITQTTPTATGTEQDWVFDMSTVNPDDPATFTIEKGDNVVRAHRAGYGLINELTVSGSRSEVTIAGSGMAQALEDGITMTSGATGVPLVPVLPQQVAVFIDDTSAALGTTKMGQVFSWEAKIGDRYGAVWPVDSALSSYGCHVETEPSVELQMTVEANATGMAMLDDLRAGAQRFVRIEALGAAIAGGNPYLMRLDNAAKVSGVGTFSDEDGVYALQFTLMVHHDDTWGKGLSWQLRNTLGAL